VERDVGLQGVDEAGGVHLDELHLGQVRVAARQGEEFVGVVLDRSTRRSSMISPIGLSVIGGPKRCCTRWAKQHHVGTPTVSSSRRL
jgi:hypothetical protein